MTTSLIKEPEVIIGIPTDNDIEQMKKEKIIGLDIETYDPHLGLTGSPGAARYLGVCKLDESFDYLKLENDRGFITGISVATNDKAWYIPFAHSDDNVNYIKMREFMHKIIDAEIETVGANYIYDLQWLYAYGFKFKAKVYDIQIAESLIDENRFKYGLDSLAEKYFNMHKVDEIKEWARYLGLDPEKSGVKKKVMGQMHNLPGRIVAKYAAYDAWLTIQIFREQLKIMKQDNLERVFDLETRITPCILEMIMHGVKIDLEKAKKYNEEQKIEEEQLLRNLYKMAKTETINPWSADSLKPVLDNLEIPYKLTATGKPQLTEEFFLSQNRGDNSDDFLSTLYAYRKINKARRDFLEGTLLDETIHVKHYNSDGTIREIRIHGQFHQNKKDDSGTTTGRFSSSNPNLQQQPSRDPKWKKIIRSCYIPDDGFEWIRYDYSQQELRVLLHYAYTNKKRGADKLYKQLWEEPRTDYHQMTADMAGITRRHAKDINFGINYGMGKAKLAANLGLSMKESEKLMNLYNEKVPYAKALYYDVMNAAAKRGYISTLYGRRRHFDMWEPVKDKTDWELGTYYKPQPLDKAREEYPDRRLQRAMTYKALNALIQGGSADMTKAGMLQVWEKYHIAPALQVHDELDFCCLPSEYKEDVQNIMEHCVDVCVPIVADPESGPSWGELKE